MPGRALLIMAAGIGSRYGGLKQIDPVGPSGEIIIDYSIYDALRAGFDKVVFIIRRDIEKTFREKIGRNIESRVETEYVFQELGDLPAPFEAPPERKKPWGTGHAVLSARAAVAEPFAVVNADDFYGADAYRLLAGYLESARDSGGAGDYCLAGYVLWNTLSDHGGVARGICSVDGAGHLEEIHERTRVEKSGETVRYTRDDGANWAEAPRDSTVSMNIWGFTPGFMNALAARFPRFLEAHRSEPQAEFFIPEVVGAMIREGAARVKVLPTDEKWYGITYRQDAPAVKAAIGKMVEDGRYPQNLWGAG